MPVVTEYPSCEGCQEGRENKSHCKPGKVPSLSLHPVPRRHNSHGIWVSGHSRRCMRVPARSPASPLGISYGLEVCDLCHTFCASQKTHERAGISRNRVRPAGLPQLRGGPCRVGLPTLLAPSLGQGRPALRRGGARTRSRGAEGVQVGPPHGAEGVGTQRRRTKVHRCCEL